MQKGIKSTISNVTTSLAGRMNNSNVSTGAATTLSEDEALARAIQLSMQDQGVSSSGSSMTEEERQLQEAIRRSKKDQGGSKDKCRVQ